MGKPKFSRKKYETPSHPWQEDRIKSENELMKKYGLKNKREIWKAQTVLRKYRGQARELLAKIGSGNPQVKKESEQLLSHLTRVNVLPLNSNLDDVLALDIEPLLSRRLETLTYLKGLSNTPNQARQMISHGHISIGGRKITIPGYIVTKDEENAIGYFIDSPLNDIMHPARPKSDFKAPTDREKHIDEDKKPDLTKDIKPKEKIKPDKKNQEKTENEKPDQNKKNSAKEGKTEKKIDDKIENYKAEEQKQEKTTKDMEEDRGE